MTMKSMTLKNIWARRQQNIWIFIELIIFTFVTWAVADPIIRNAYIESLPLGYEPERMVVANVKYIDFSQRDQMGIVNKLRKIEGVESVYGCTNSYPTHKRVGIKQNYSIIIMDGDTVCVNDVVYYTDMDYFKTHGIRTIAGKDPDKVGSHEIVISKTLAEKHFGSTDIIGEKVTASEYLFNPEKGYGYYGDAQQEEGVIASIVDDVRFCQQEYFPSATIYLPKVSYDKIVTLFYIRMREGYEPSDFVETHRKDVESAMQSDNSLMTKLLTAEDLIREEALKQRLTQPNRSRVVLASFFLISLTLGLVGSFWINARKRNEESGIMRAFGATKPRIAMAFIKEGLTMLTIAFAIVAIMYFNYVNITEAYVDYGWVFEEIYVKWIDKFWPRFLFSGAIVYTMMAIIVCIGVLIPTIKMSNMSTIDALNDKA